MRVWMASVCAAIAILGGTAKEARADAFLLATIDLSLHQWVGCSGSCLSPGHSVSGSVEILYDAVTYQVIASTPFQALLPDYDGPRLTRFSGQTAFPPYDCTGDGAPLCYSFRSFDYSELSTGWRRHFWLDGLYPHAADPYLGLLPDGFEVRESGILDGRSVMFEGAGAVSDFQVVNSSLQPIPEPSSLLLVLGGLGGLVAKFRREA